ncbi:putative periplasmic lipoprotein [Rhizobium alvei]|uniref:Lipoprotein n=1 Tax=Rhizobium alvei TaxID=1132659 RepID=A0ABT8YGX6_9HYPH|nr:hypothetical protein [Rhizobium alvei]MDO6962923.1 hypothetical protein [Rhizobium alvei]
MKHLLMVAALPVLLAGCAATKPPEVTAGRDPADPSAEIRPSHHHSPVIYTARVPVEPEPWKKLNEDLSSSEEDPS